MKLFRRKRVIFTLLIVLTIVIAMSQIYKQDFGIVLRSRGQGNGLATTKMPLFGNFPVFMMKNQSTGEKHVQNLQQILKTIRLTNTSQSIKNSTYSRTEEMAILNSYECIPTEDPSPIKTPFKFYIYDLPSKFNTDIRYKMSTAKDYAYCYNLNYCGMGEELNRLNLDQLGHIKESPVSLVSKQEKLVSLASKQENHETFAYDISVRNTHQFALEVVMHHKLMRSPYRTLDPNKADMFYIPGYTGLTCLSDREGGNAFVNDLFAYLRQNTSYFLSGKPHFSTLSKIQREQGSDFCGTLRHRDSANITYIAIEKESNSYWAAPGRIYGNKILVAPYPSYIHFISKPTKSHLKEFYPNVTDIINNSNVRLQVPGLSERKVKLFLASSTRRSNPFRAKLIDQFKTQTDLDLATYFKTHNVSTNTTDDVYISDIMLRTPECSKSHRTTTIPWMLNSIFCLQPPGDSPTRKSFYDSILSGCIPIIFALKHKTVLPFQKWLDYSKFTVTIDEKVVSDRSVLDIIQDTPQHNITVIHDNLLRVAKWFQYSMNDDGIDQDTDAVTLILEQLREMVIPVKTEK